MCVNRDVTEYLQSLLRKSGYNFHTTAEKEIVRLIKEKTSYVSLSPTKEAKENSGKTADFLLPDGQIIKVHPILASVLISSDSSAANASVPRKSCSAPKYTEWNTPAFPK